MLGWGAAGGEDFLLTNAYFEGVKHILSAKFLEIFSFFSGPQFVSSG